MELEYIYYFVLSQFLLLPVLLVIMIRYLQKKSGMSRQLEVETGSLLNESGWGDAKINGVHLKNCVKVGFYENGTMIRILPIFCFGKLWLPKSELIIGEIEESGFLRHATRKLNSNNDEVILLGKLASSDLVI